jgi:hypothetical protein
MDCRAMPLLPSLSSLLTSTHGLRRRQAMDDEEVAISSRGKEAAIGGDF